MKVQDINNPASWQKGLKLLLFLYLSTNLRLGLVKVFFPILIICLKQRADFCNFLVKTNFS